MKKLLSLLLPLALALSLAACGEKSADEAARQTPPTLTVTSANACSVTLKSSSYDWTYTQGLQSMTAIACGAHPLDETSRDITPVLEMPFTVSAAYFYTVTLDFGDNSPESVSLRCWPSDAWGTTGMPSETVTAQRQDNGTFRAELPQSDGIFAVDALWDGSSATYTFCTQAEGAAGYVSETFSVEPARVREIEVDWLGGSVMVVLTDDDSLSFAEMAYQDVPEEQRLSYALDGDTLKIDFCRSGHLLSSSPEKQLVLSIPRSLTLEKFEADTTAAAVNVTGLHTQTVDISTVSGNVDLAAKAYEIDISTTGGCAAVDADFYQLDFSAVSGSLTLAMQRAAEVEAETTSGGVTIHLPPSSYGFALDFETVSGTPEITFDANGGDGHWTYGDKASTLTVDTASGNLSLD
ncbi:DUF4097 family beta strand repeat-containing protein [Hominicoprocola fusiformis]